MPEQQNGPYEQLDLFNEDEPVDRVEDAEEGDRNPICGVCGERVEGDVYITRLGHAHRTCRHQV